MAHRWFLPVAGLFLLLNGQSGASQEAPEAAGTFLQLSGRHGLKTSLSGASQACEGNLTNLLGMLFEWADSKPKPIRCDVEFLRQSEDPATWKMSLVSEPEAVPTSVESVFLSFASALEIIPEDTRVTGFSIRDDRWSLTGVSFSFEAVNLYRGRILESRAAFDSVEDPTASKKGGMVDFSLKGSLRVGDPWPGGWGKTRLEALTTRLERLVSLKVPAASLPSLDDVELMGRLQSGGKVFVLVRSKEGNVRKLPVGFRFTDGEILAVDGDGVKLRRGKPESTEGDVVVVPFPVRRH